MFVPVVVVAAVDRIPIEVVTRDDADAIDDGRRDLSKSRRREGRQCALDDDQLAERGEPTRVAGEGERGIVIDVAAREIKREQLRRERCGPELDRGPAREPADEPEVREP